jgi:hypothetical protein
MAALVAAIHVFRATGKDMDGREKPGHDARTCDSLSIDGVC